MARYIDADELRIAIENRHTVRHFFPTKEDLQLLDIFEQTYSEVIYNG